MPSPKAADPSRHVGHAKPAKQIRQFPLISHDLRDAGQCGDLLRRPRGIAADHDNLRAWIFPRKPANRLTTLGVAFISYGTSIDDTQLSRIVIIRVFITNAEQ